MILWFCVSLWNKMEMKLKWFGPIFSATLEFKSCSCFAQLYQKVLDKERVECANQTATKSTELQLDDKSLPLPLENIIETFSYMSNIVNIVHLFFINLCLSLFSNLSTVPKDYQTYTIWLFMIPAPFLCTPNNVIKTSAVLPVVFGQLWEQSFFHEVA